MKRKVYSLPISDVETSEISDGDFIKVKLYAISNGVNRNYSEFMEDGFEDGIKTIYNKPILAYYNKDIGDTEEHNSKLSIDEFGQLFYDYDYEGAEKPVGVIPESADIYVEEKDGKKWIVIDSGLIWTEYNRRLSNLIKKQLKKKVSVEVEALDSTYTDDDVEQINKWKFLGITILGKDTDGVEYQEGIEGAHLTLESDDFEKQFKKYVSRLNYSLNVNKNTILSKYINDNSKEKEGKTHDTFLSDDDWGTEEAITVDTSKESVSNDSWGDVDKQNLRDTVLKAKNYKSLVKKVYLDVNEGWEENPSSNLKYPVMQYKDGKLVYNSNGLLSAQQYGEQHDEAVARKAKSLRKKLGLIKSEKEEHMKKFIEQAADAGFVFLGLFENALRFVKVEQACDEDKIEAKEKMEVYEVEREKAEEFACDESEEKAFAWDELTGKEVKMAEEENDSDEADDNDADEGDDAEGGDNDDNDDADQKEEMAEKEKEEMAAQFAEEKKKLEEERDEYAHKCESLEAELKTMKDEKFKEDTDAVLADADEDIDEDDKQNLVAMRDEGKFSTVEDFKKEIAYRAYNNKKSSREKLSYGTNKNVNKVVVKKDGLFDRLSKI